MWKGGVWLKMFLAAAFVLELDLVFLEHTRVIYRAFGDAVFLAGVSE